MNEKTREFRNNLANRFVQSLSESPLEWRKQWFNAKRAFNGITGKEYRGINSLWVNHVMIKKGFSDPRFMTFAQAKKQGLSIKKGSKGTPVEFWSPYDVRKKKAVSWTDASKDPENIRIICRFYTVFNGDQINGITPYHDERNTNTKPNQQILRMAESMGVAVKHGGNRAAYSPVEDCIYMPKPEQFESDDAYAATLAHELAHATGHESRLARNQKNQFGNEDYAKEELTAEITACFFCSALGIEMTDEHIKNHQAYVQNWAQIINKNPDVLMRSVKEADKASDLMMVHAGLMDKKEYDKLHNYEEEPTVSKNSDAEQSDVEQNENYATTEKSSNLENSPNMVYVKPHTRNGRYVKGHYRKVR